MCVKFHLMLFYCADVLKVESAAASVPGLTLITACAQFSSFTSVITRAVCEGSGQLQLLHALLCQYVPISLHTWKISLPMPQVQLIGFYFCKQD